MTSTLRVALLRCLCGRHASRGCWTSATPISRWQRSYSDLSSGNVSPESSHHSPQGPVQAESYEGNFPSQSPAREALGSIRTGRDIAMVFTCKKCETRAVKSFSRQSYERGLVLVRCPGCENLHLVADNLGWFGDKGFRIAGMDIRTLASQGPAAPQAVSPGQRPVSPEDIIGASKVQQLVESLAAAEASAGGVRESADGRGTEVHSPGGSHLVLELTDPRGDGQAGVVEISPEDAAAYARTVKGS